MSEQADRQKTKRQKFAAPGGYHDWLIRLLRVGLPSVIGVILALLLVSPFSESREMSFVLAKDEVNKAKERMKMTEALYRGEDSKGRPFALRADSAIQKSSAEPIVRMSGLNAQLQMEDGPAWIDAAQGTYNMDSEIVGMAGLHGQMTMGSGFARIEAAQGTYSMKSAIVKSVGPLFFNDGKGFAMTANNVALMMKSKTLESFGAVNGSMRVGKFSAGKLRADLNARIVRLEGGARLRINQGAIR
jgi:lipopolysaccharide export system protein LptC